MALKKRNKVSPEFSMSSLTDIIFLLLIFFMLTSSLVSPEAINLKLPSNKTISTVEQFNKIKLKIDRKGRYKINGRTHTIKGVSDILDKAISKSGNPKKVTLSIEPDANAPVEKVVEIFDKALTLDINPVLAAQKFVD